MWRAVTIAGKPADVFDPPGERPRFALLYLHNSQGQTLAGVPFATQLLTRHALACVCPHGKRSWWTDRPCAEFDPTVSAERHLVDAVLPFARQRWELPPRRIGLLGVGMGGQGALKLAFRYPQALPAVAAIAPALDYHDLHGRGTPLDDMYDSKEQCRQDTAPMHLPPHEPPQHIWWCHDPDDEHWHRGGDRLHEKMGALGVEHVADLETRAAGQAEAYFEHMLTRAVDFLLAGLEKESRRLL